MEILFTIVSLLQSGHVNDSFEAVRRRIAMVFNISEHNPLQKRLTYTQLYEISLKFSG